MKETGWYRFPYWTKAHYYKQINGQNFKSLCGMNKEIPQIVPEVSEEITHPKNLCQKCLKKFIIKQACLKEVGKE